MQIHLTRETARLIDEEIEKGYFRSVDEVIIAGVQVLREKNAARGSVEVWHAKNLVELFEDSPFKGMSVEFERG